jgi:hypothetical protein
MGVEMKEVGDPRTGDRNRIGQKPIRESPVPAGGELQDEPDDEQRDLRAAASKIPVRLEVVRGDFPASGGQDLHHPEEEDDLGDLCGNGRRKEAPNHRYLVV